MLWQRALLPFTNRSLALKPDCGDCAAGALVGPPWSKRENGFVLSEACSDGIKLYYEPHCDYDESAVAKIGKVDVMVTPANSQVLIKFPLVGTLSIHAAHQACYSQPRMMLLTLRLVLQSTSARNSLPELR